MLSKLQYISQGSTAEEQIQNIKNVLEVGVKWIQLRMKKFPEEVVFETAKETQKLCYNAKATFIVNDYVSLARKINADGVHLGLSDTNAVHARAILGEDKIIGGTANTWNDILSRSRDRVDYIGLGPFAFTTTKDKLSPVLGINGYQLLMSKLKKNNIAIPVYAIGGIQINDISQLLETGIYGIAVSGLLSKNEDIKTNYDQIIKSISNVKNC